MLFATIWVTVRGAPYVILVAVVTLPILFGDDMSVIYPRKGLDARTHLPMKYRNIPLDRLERFPGTPSLVRK